MAPSVGATAEDFVPLLLPLLVCSDYGVQTQIGKNLMILSLVLLRVPFFDK